MITGRTAVAIANSVVNSFSYEEDFEPRRWSDEFRDRLEAEEFPRPLIEEFSCGSVARGRDSMLKLRGGELLIGARYRGEVLAFLKIDKPADAGEELLRRLASIVRRQLHLSLFGWGYDPLGYQRELKLAISDLDLALEAAGYRWHELSTSYQRESSTLVDLVPSTPAIEQLVLSAKLHNEPEILRQFAIADRALALGGDVAWQAASVAARESMAKIFEGVVTKLGAGFKANNAASIRLALEAEGVVSSSQRLRLDLFYKALCETAHNVSSREDAVLDVATALLVAEFVLRRFVLIQGASDP